MRENPQVDCKATWNPTLTGAALDRFLLAEGRHWDAIPVPGFGLEDLSSRSLARFRKLAERSGRMAYAFPIPSDAALLDKLHLLDGDTLRRAGVLLFGKDPERLVPGAFLEIRSFRNDGELLLDHDEVHGDLFTQIDAGYGLLRNKYLEASISYLGSERIEVLPVPTRALHEALVNAVVHKDYTAGVPIQVSV